jgi:signal transduction histidine kinase
VSGAGGPPLDPRLHQVIHDLRTPLTVVVGFAELLERSGESFTPEQRQEYTARLAEAARQLRQLLDELGSPRAS